MLNDLVDLGNPQKVLAEIKNVVSLTHKDVDEALADDIQPSTDEAADQPQDGPRCYPQGH